MEIEKAPTLCCHLVVTQICSAQIRQLYFNMANQRMADSQQLSQVAGKRDIWGLKLRLPYLIFF